METTTPPEQAPIERAYDRLRGRIHRYLESRGGATSKFGEYLLLVPDVFILLWRLVNDRRVSGKDKVLLGSGIAYYLLPIDIMPEAIVGPMGYLDDLVFAVYILNRILAATDIAVLREHWSGSADLLETIRRVLAQADDLIGSDKASWLKKRAK